MKNIKNNRAIPESEWSKNPELAQQLIAVRNYLEKTPFSKAFPNKYKAILEDDILEKTHIIFANNPTMPLKSVVTTVLNSIDEDMSADLLLKMTRLIIQEWQNAPAAVNAEKDIEALV
jgi:hypothetical protein